MEQEAYQEPTIAGKVGSIVDKSTEYGKNSLELMKLKGLHTTASVVTILLSRISIILLFMIFTMVLSAGAAIWIGQILGKMYLGFFIVAGFYLVIGVLMIAFLHKLIEKPVSDLIISQALQ